MSSNAVTGIVYLNDLLTIPKQDINSESKDCGSDRSRYTKDKYIGNYSQLTYGHISELGMVLIPKNLQKQSNFKALSTIDFSICKNMLILKVNNRFIKEKTRFIDEIGRISIPIQFIKDLSWSTDNTVAIYLIDSETIIIRALTKIQGVNKNQRKC